MFTVCNSCLLVLHFSLARKYGLENDASWFMYSTDGPTVPLCWSFQEEKGVPTCILLDSKMIQGGFSLRYNPSFSESVDINGHRLVNQVYQVTANSLAVWS